MKKVKTLDEMTDMEAVDCIEKMAELSLQDLKDTKETFQDLYSPVEDWIPKLCQIARHWHTVCKFPERFKK